MKYAQFRKIHPTKQTAKNVKKVMRGKLQPGSKPPEYLIETTRKHIEEDKVQQSIKKIVLKKDNLY